MEETDDRGRKTRTTEARDKRRGIPQGSPISPLLANLYMRRFVLGWKMFGLERTLGTRHRDLRRRRCATNALTEGGADAVQEMRVGPSEPAVRSRLQTTASCDGQEPWW